MGCFAGRLEGMLLEAKGFWAEAEKAYSSFLEDNPFDQVSFGSFLSQIPPSIEVNEIICFLGCF